MSGTHDSRLPGDDDAWGREGSTSPSPDWSAKLFRKPSMFDRAERALVGDTLLQGLAWEGMLMTAGVTKAMVEKLQLCMQQLSPAYRAATETVDAKQWKPWMSLLLVAAEVLKRADFRLPGTPVKRRRGGGSSSGKRKQTGAGGVAPAAAAPAAAASDAVERVLNTKAKLALMELAKAEEASAAVSSRAEARAWLTTSLLKAIMAGDSAQTVHLLQSLEKFAGSSSESFISTLIVLKTEKPARWDTLSLVLHQFFTTPYADNVKPAMALLQAELAKAATDE